MDNSPESLDTFENQYKPKELALPTCPQEASSSVGQTALSVEASKAVEEAHSDNGGDQSSTFVPEEVAVIDTSGEETVYHQEDNVKGKSDTTAPITFLGPDSKGGSAEEVAHIDIPNHSEEKSASGNDMTEQFAINASNQTSDSSEEEELKKLENDMEYDSTSGPTSDETGVKLEKALDLNIENSSARPLMTDGLTRNKEPSSSTSKDQEGANIARIMSRIRSSMVIDEHGQLNVEAFMTELVNVCDDANTARMIYSLVMQDGSMSLRQFLAVLASRCMSLYDDSGEDRYIDKSIGLIEASKDALELANEGEPIDDLAALYVEGQIFRQQFERLGDMNDIERAIGAFDKAMECVDHDDRNMRATLLAGQGGCLFRRFERLGDLGDLDLAVKTQQETVDLTPEGHPDKPRLLSNVGSCLLTRFQRLGDSGDLDLAVKSQQQAVNLTPNGHPDKPSLLGNVGDCLRTRFERLGDLGDLDLAVKTLQQAVDLTPDRLPDKPSLLGSLGNCLLTRFERLGDLGDLDLAVKALQQALDLTPDRHPSRPSRLSNVGNCLHTRFLQLGDLGDLDLAVKAQQEAIDLTPDGHPDKISWLSNVGSCLLTRFQRLGDLGNLDLAVKAQQQAVDLTPDGHPSKPSRLGTMGNCLLARFERLGDLGDLDLAVKTQQQALEITPDGHPSRPSRLSNVGNCLLTRFSLLGDLGDLDLIVKIQQQAVDLTPDGHSDKASRLSNLGNCLSRRFERLGDLGDLDLAVKTHQQAVDLMPDGHPDKPALLNNVGNCLLTRFSRLRDLGDLDLMVKIQQQAVDLTPDGHHNKPIFLINLSNTLQPRLIQRPTLQDLSLFISSLRKAATSPSGPPSVRFEAARRLATALHPQLQSYQIAIDLIPQVVWLGTTITQRYNDLDRLGELVMDAVSAACAQEEYDFALEWFEQGRAIIWGQILQLRSPVDKLQIDHPDLANELTRIARALEMAGTASRAPGESTSAEDAAQEHRRLAKKWEDTLAIVRKLPDFTDFLHPKSASVLKHSLADKMVVLVNVSRRHSEALILQPGSGHSSISHLPLSTLSREKVNEARDKLINALRQSGVRFRDSDRGSAQRRSSPGAATVPKILEMLWNDVAKPILDHLGHLNSQPTGDLPHITWCLSGALAVLPLHAAGIYTNTDTSNKLFNYAISSYTPSLTSLVEGLERTPTTLSARSLLAITQANTPELPSLPATKREVDQVQTLMHQYSIDVTRMDGDQATVKEVRDAMKDHSWIHLACHGIQHAIEPTKSAFSLHDGSLELIDIMKERLNQAELAYLSACQTASGHAALPNEAIHLAAGMSSAGYRTVIATLWSIGDADAPVVAQEFYDRLLTNSDRGAARALHEAVGVLREQVGVTNLLAWVPYIHMGC